MAVNIKDRELHTGTATHNSIQLINIIILLFPNAFKKVKEPI